jgi:hypothetical protein
MGVIMLATSFIALLIYFGVVQKSFKVQPRRKLKGNFQIKG